MPTLAVSSQSISRRTTYMIGYDDAMIRYHLGLLDIDGWVNNGYCLYSLTQQQQQRRT